MVANATIVDGDVDVDREVAGEFFALGGLSDSANFSGLARQGAMPASVRVKRPAS